MDPETIREARRLLHDLIYTGSATFKSGTTLHPKDEVLVGIVEKVASKKVEEPIPDQTVEGYIPQQTYRTKEKDRHEIIPDAPPTQDFSDRPVQD